MIEHETPGETDARQALEAQLAPGEKLLVYTRGQIPGVLGTRPFFLGLTGDRLILLSPTKGMAGPQVHTIWRENIVNVKWSPIWGRLRIRLGGETLDFAPRGGRWKRHATQLVDSFQTLPDARQGSIGEMTQRRLAQARDFNSLGLYAVAQAELKKLETAYSSESRSEIEALSSQLSDKRFALKAAAGFLIGDATLSVLLSGLASVGIASPGSLLCSVAFAPLIDAYIAVNLWRGRIREGQSWAILFALLMLFFAASDYAAGGFLLDLVMRISFSLSLLLVVLGQPKRARTFAAIGIFAVGFVGLFMLGLLAGVTGIPIP